MLVSWKLETPSDRSKGLLPRRRLTRSIMSRMTGIAFQRWAPEQPAGAPQGTRPAAGVLDHTGSSGGSEIRRFRPCERRFANLR